MSTVSVTQQFLSFALNHKVEAMMPTQQLSEVLSLAGHQIVSIPEVPPQVIGVCNWRGEVLWLADLGSLLGLEPFLPSGYRQANYSVIVTHHQGNSLGLLVERVNEMLWCSQDDIQTIPVQQNTLQPSMCIQGCWVTPSGKTILALDSGAIATALHH